MKPLVGINVYPDEAYLRRTLAIREAVDFWELSPETLWKSDLRPSAWRQRLLEEVRAFRKPVAGHGLFFGLGEGDPRRRDAWLRAIEADHQDFSFLWYSEHLGALESRGRILTLPVPFPPSEAAAEIAAEKLGDLQRIVPEVAFENPAGPFLLSDPLSDARFLGRVAARAKCSLLLDLHNIWTLCLNASADPDEYLAALDPRNVLVIHLSGGSESEADWTSSGRTLRLDSHDGLVPEWCWAALERLLPRCPNLRGIVLERLPEGLSDEQVPSFEAEFARLRAIVEQGRDADESGDRAVAGLPIGDGLTREEVVRLVDRLVDVVLDADASEVLDRWLGDLSPTDPLRSFVEAIDRDACEVASLLVKKLRFRRLVSSPEQARLFERDPGLFLQRFRRYDEAHAPTTVFADEELDCFHRFLAGDRGLESA